MVSHRFSTVRMADLIVVLDAPRVVDVGSHAELMARGGPYAELYGIQARLPLTDHQAVRILPYCWREAITTEARRSSDRS